MSNFAVTGLSLTYGSVAFRVPLHVSGISRTYGAVAFPLKGTARRTVVVDMEGNPLGELEEATHGQIVWGLNRPDDFTVTMSSQSPKAALVLAERFREVQLWRGNHLLTWGPIVSVDQGTSGELVLTCKGVDWYLGRRFIGKAKRTNYVPQPSFETGLVGWSLGYNPNEPADGRDPAYRLLSLSTTRAVTGTRSARLELPSDEWPRYGATFGTVFEFTPDPAGGDEFTAAVQVFIVEADLRSVEGGSLTLVEWSTTQTELVTSDDGAFAEYKPLVLGVSKVQITEHTPVHQWARLETSLPLDTRVAPGEPRLVGLIVEGIRGVMFVDDPTLTLNERLQFSETDQALIALGIVEHLQDPAYDKSDLNIDVYAPATGVLRDRTYLHSEHPPGLRSIQEFTGLDDGFDYRMTYTTTTRHFGVEFPQSGAYRPKVGFELGRNIASYRWSFDGESASSSVTVLGQGSGSDREEGAAVDTTDWANDLILEEVTPAAPETPIEALDNLAAERIVTTRNPEVLEVSTFPVTSARPGVSKLLGYLRLGDVVPVTIRDGSLAIEGTHYRIVKSTLNPDDTMDLTLNRRDAA